MGKGPIYPRTSGLPTVNPESQLMQSGSTLLQLLDQLDKELDSEAPGSGLDALRPGPDHSDPCPVPGTY